MKLNYTTKIRKSGGSLITSIPNNICDIISLDQKDQLNWEVSIEDNNVKISIKKTE
jgi:antitoxin component of MazEF toxin-antitoxin module